MGYEARSTAPERENAYLVGCCAAQEDGGTVYENLSELSALVKTLGTDVCGEMVIKIREPNPRYLIGSGKVLELSEKLAETHADVVIFDDPLGPSQQRNLEKELRCKVIDRQEVILDIFAERAQTREAVLQVDLARCRYFLPRLTGAWGHLSRQRGGNTGARGEGEKQIELDKRMLRERIALLERELEEVRKRRATQRKERIRHGMPTAAIVGYTNAGKSTLLNELTKSTVLSEDKLFATLDPTTRRLTLPDHTDVLLTDTVGFVQKLPHSLIEAFKSTLEEAIMADMILLVLDISSQHVMTQWETTMSVLKDLQAEEKPMIVIFNKTDLARDPVSYLRMKGIVPDAVFLSCKEHTGLDLLCERIMQQVNGQSDISSVEIPVERSELIAKMHGKCHVFEEKYGEDGIYRAVVKIIPAFQIALSPYVIKERTRSGKKELEV